MDGNIYHNSSAKASIAWWIYLFLPRSEAMIGPLYKYQADVDLVCPCWLYLKWWGEKGKKKTVIERLEVEWRDKPFWLKENNHYFTYY